MNDVNVLKKHRSQTFEDDEQLLLIWIIWQLLLIWRQLEGDSVSEEMYDMKRPCDRKNVWYENTSSMSLSNSLLYAAKRLKYLLFH